ncbi:cupin domain-containing protein [Paenibacillus glycanilyticus]|uniref:cupin domain-containing protein n=1 Tax=Paenibacillus glycanilyticus TaxID=126569 RepID=UPI002042239A|nr:cupin domain-containing protein [Paenibacillus glycanilyticus]MCM3628256.1 cupin domain-containing protein [Paenibacillus glycanilyticus]
MSKVQKTTDERHSVFHRNEEIVWNQVDHVPGESICIRVKGEDTNGAYAILDLRKNPSNGPSYGPPIHIHQRTDEIFRVVEGKARFHVDGKEFDAEAGDIVVVPKGIRHTFANFGDTPLHLQITFTPAGDELAFQDSVGKSIDEIIEMSRTKYQVIFTGPPLAK